MAAETLVHQVETDYYLAGDLTADQIKQVASTSTYKTWICLLDGEEQEQIKTLVESAGDVKFVNIPLNMPEGMTTETARKVEQAMHYVQKPVIVQCKSATRASAALAIHYADTHMMNAEQVHAWAGEHGLKYPGHDGLKQWVGDCADSRVKLTQELRAHYEPQKIIFRQLFDRTSCTYTYLLACPTTLEGVLIDPVDTLVERDTAIIREMGIKLKYGLNTHVHADHITGTGLLKQQFTGMQSVLSKASGGQADKHVEPGEKITFGSLFLEVRATPGHTAGCVTYVLGEEQGMAFTGDALLIRGCGRTDFQGGSADTLYDSVHSQIFTLPEECLLYPGHDYRGRMTSTVYEEKQFNPRLSHGKEKFLHIMDTLGLPNPKMLDVAVPANLVCGLHEVHDPVATESKA